MASTAVEDDGLSKADEALAARMQATAATAMATREGTQPVEKDLELDEKGRTLKNGMEEGLVLRSAAGQKFSADPKGGKSASYQAMSRTDKSEFRKQWCKDCFNEHVSVLKEKVQIEPKTKMAKMKMTSGRALIKREGAEAFERYASKCIELGPPYIEYDHMWERYNFGDVTKEYREEFTKKQQIIVRTSGDATSSNEPQPATAAATEGVAERRRINQTESGVPETPNKQPKQQGAPKDDKALACEANKLRTKIQGAQGSARQLQDFMKASPTEWEWANKTKLVAAAAALSDFSQTSTFVQTFILTGATPAFKASYKTDPILMRNEYSNFINKGSSLAQGLVKETNRLLAMSAADKKATSES
jgi:hypothetical protein